MSQQRTGPEGPVPPCFAFSKPVSEGLIRELAFKNGYRESRAREITRSHPKVLGLLDYHRSRERLARKIVVFFSVAIGTPVSGDPWVVFSYEADMLLGMCTLLRDGNEYAALPHHVRNAVVESALLHTRQLADILLSQGRHPDDINLSGLLPGFQPSRLSEPQALYDGSNSGVNSPRWTLNKRLAHPTSHRGASYDYSALLNQLAPLLDDIVREVQERHTAGGQA